MAANTAKKLRRSPSQERSRILVSSVLTAAREILIKAGLKKFNTVKIAQRAGVGVGSIYEYFENKQSVFQSLLKEEIERNLKALVDSLPAHQTGDLDLGPVIEKMMEHFGQIRTLTEYLFLSLPREFTTPLIMHSRARAAELIAEKYQLSASDRKTLIFLVNIFMDTIHSMRWHEKEGKDYPPREEVVRHLSRISRAVLASGSQA